MKSQPTIMEIQRGGMALLRSLPSGDKAVSDGESIHDRYWSSSSQLAAIKVVMTLSLLLIRMQSVGLVQGNVLLSLSRLVRPRLLTAFLCEPGGVQPSMRASAGHAGDSWLHEHSPGVWAM